MKELIQRIGKQGSLTQTAWSLPENMSAQQWKEAGMALSRVEGAVMWWIGDWWAFGEHKYGDRKAIVESDDWSGPAYETCRAAGWVCEKFGTVRRRTVLPFSFHREVMALPEDEADELLDWCEKPNGNGKLPTQKQLREEVRRRKKLNSDDYTTEPEGGCTSSDLHALVAAGHKFGTIYADPPWLYGNQGTRAATGNHYGGMTVEEMCDPEVMPIEALTMERAHLHLWTTNAFLFEARKLIEAWGFEYKSCYVWVKPQMGIGNYWRVSHEFMLLGVRGSLPFNDRGQMSWGRYDRTKHSEKPERIRDIIQKTSPTPRLELFGRRIVPGWTVWGNEIQRSVFDVVV